MKPIFVGFMSRLRDDSPNPTRKRFSLVLDRHDCFRPTLSSHRDNRDNRDSRSRGRVHDDVLRHLLDIRVCLYGIPQRIAASMDLYFYRSDCCSRSLYFMARNSRPNRAAETSSKAHRAMNRFPQEARPILEAIRKEVPRWELEDIHPFFSNRTQSLRDKNKRCPMGCLNDAIAIGPMFSNHFTGRLSWTDDMIEAFGEWFDAFEDPRKAIRAVWGPE